MTATRGGAGGSVFSRKPSMREGMGVDLPQHIHLLINRPVFFPSFNSSRATSTKTVTNNHGIRFLTFICQSWAQLSALGFCSRKCLGT